MSSTQQNSRPTKVKRGREELTTAVTSPLPPKRQRSEAPETDLTKSAAPTTIYNDRTALQTYQHMLPKSAEGRSFLFSPRFSEVLQVSAEQVAIRYQVTKDQAIEEFRRLIAIKTFTVDEDATKISPTPLMEELWHAAILDTKLYADLQAALGLNLHHRPSGASDQEAESHDKRLIVMKAVYNAFFLTHPLGFAPSQPKDTQGSARLQESDCFIYVKTLHGETLTINIDMKATIYGVKTAVERIKGIPPNQQKLIYPAAELDNSRTLENYGIRNGSTMYLVERLAGC